jgi:hypothetical protein
LANASTPHVLFFFFFLASAFSVGGKMSDATYGELTVEGAARLFEQLDLGQHDVFYDLGSGDGKVVLLAAVLCGVERSVGVELDPDRHSLAVAMLSSAVASSAITSDEADRVSFVNGDAFAPRAFEGATVIYMLSNVFPPELFGRFLTSLAKLAPESQRALRVIATSRALPTDLVRKFNEESIDAVVTISPQPHEIHVAASWTPSLAISIYTVEPRLAVTLK